MQLTSDEKRAIQDGKPVRVREDDLEWVVVRADMFDRMQASLVPDFDPTEAYPLVNEVMAEDDANDPLLDSYQVYRQ